MSRLDSFIRRLEAQRTCLDWALAVMRDVPGAVLELGLGNGRTYDHLRSRLDGTRVIFAFDRQLAAHPNCVPEPAYLRLGDFHDTLAALVATLARGVAFVHADTGSGDSAASRAQAQALVALIDPLLAPGAVVASDQDMAPEAARGWTPLALPAGVAAGRYFLYRKTG